MSQEPYPKQIKKTDIPLLVEKAKRARRKGNIASIGLFFSYGLIGFFLSPILLFLSGQLVINSYKQPVFMTTEIQVAIVITFFALYASVLLYLYLGLEIAIRKIAKIRYDELVFYECILIADNLEQNRRQEAIKEVDGFVSWLHAFQSTSWYNSKAKRYAPEIKLLNKGRKEIKRLLLFSTDKRIIDLFINFGLTLVNNYDASAFSFLKSIIGETEKYGKLEGWFDRIRGEATNIQIILYSVSIAIGIAVSLTTILKLLGIV
jgi:hypothetical protein